MSSQDRAVKRQTWRRVRTAAPLGRAQNHCRILQFRDVVSQGFQNRSLIGGQDIAPDVEGAEGQPGAIHQTPGRRRPTSVPAEPPAERPGRWKRAAAGARCRLRCGRARRVQNDGHGADFADPAMNSRPPDVSSSASATRRQDVGTAFETDPPRPPPRPGAPGPPWDARPGIGRAGKARGPLHDGVLRAAGIGNERNRAEPTYSAPAGIR